MTLLLKRDFFGKSLTVNIRTLSQYEAIGTKQPDIIAGEFLPAHLKLLPENFTVKEKCHIHTRRDEFGWGEGVCREGML